MYFCAISQYSRWISMGEYSRPLSRRSFRLQVTS